jgi:uncharacterized protein
MFESWMKGYKTLRCVLERGSIQMQSTRIEILEQLYKAINENDIKSAMQLFSPQIVRIEEAKGDTPEKTFHGIEDVKDHIIEGRGTWSEGSCEPERFTMQNDSIIAFLHVRVRLKGNTDWIDGHLADVFTFKDNLIVHWKTFWKGQDAIEWLGVKE